MSNFLIVLYLLRHTLKLLFRSIFQGLLVFPKYIGRYSSHGHEVGVSVSFTSDAI